jgi:hypothetical protein
MPERPQEFAAVWAGDGLLLCDLPLRRPQLDQLREAGVRLVLDLCDEQDGRPPREGLDDHVAVAARELEDGRPVAIGCGDGPERAPIVAATLRALRADDAPRTALAEIARISPLAAPLSGSAEALEAWARDRR